MQLQIIKTISFRVKVTVLIGCNINFKNKKYHLSKFPVFYFQKVSLSKISEIRKLVLVSTAGNGGFVEIIGRWISTRWCIYQHRLVKKTQSTTYNAIYGQQWSENAIYWSYSRYINIFTLAFNFRHQMVLQNIIITRKWNRVCFIHIFIWLN